MAPFVELEWGREAYSIMSRIKRVIDPDGILNPGVLLNDDPHVHLKNIKTLPQIDEETDRCMECGFCEPQCPSRRSPAQLPENRSEARNRSKWPCSPSDREGIYLRRIGYLRRGMDVRDGLPG